MDSFTLRDRAIRSARGTAETMIEVLDPDRGTVLARRLMEGQVIGVLEDGRVAVYYETEIGVPHVNILSVTLSGGR